MTTDRPTNVVAALAAVTAELGGIEKLSPDERRRRGLGGGDERGVSYAYRGVDQIAAAAAPLFGRYGVVIVPDVVEQTVERIEVNGKPWTDTAAVVDWRIYGPGGVDDRLDARTRGLGRDNSDKGANKALTGAYKNLLLRLLCIGDPADDTDGHTVEADAAAPTPTARELADRARAKVTFERLKMLAGTDTAESVKALAAGEQRKLTLTELGAYPEWRQQVDDLLAALLDEHPVDDHHGDTTDTAPPPTSADPGVDVVEHQTVDEAMP